MICEHDRLARQCRECAIIEDLAELESAHRMMHARNERLQKEKDELAEALRKAKEFYEGITSFYGQDLQVYNWHLNGEPEPFDNFIDDNTPDGLEESFEILRKHGLEGKEE